jgi:hypothetical protein
MDVNDDEDFLDKRVALETIVGTPPGASSLLQFDFTTHKTRDRQRSPVGAGLDRTTIALYVRPPLVPIRLPSQSARQQLAGNGRIVIFP